MVLVLVQVVVLVQVLVFFLVVAAVVLVVFFFQLQVQHLLMMHFPLLELAKLGPHIKFVPLYDLQIGG